MSKESKLEESIRLNVVGGHTDSRRVIEDLPVGYTRGSNVAATGLIYVSDSVTNLPLGQHYHINYSEIFVLAQGKGILSARAVAPGEEDNFNSRIRVSEKILECYRIDKELQGTETKMEVNSRDPARKVVKLTPGIAHTFVLNPGSILIPFIVDAPNDFNPEDKDNYVQFRLN